MHSEGLDSSISAEVSLQEFDDSNATEPVVQALVTQDAAAPPDVAADSELPRQGSNAALSQSRELCSHSRGSEHLVILDNAALDAAGQVAAVNEGSSAALVHEDRTATASSLEGTAGLQTICPLDVLAALRPRQQSLLTPAAGSELDPSSLAPSARDSLSSCQLPQSLHVGTDVDESRQSRPHSAALDISRSPSLGGLAASHVSTDAGPVSVHVSDSTQSSPTAEACMPSREFLRQPQDKSAVSEQMLGSSQHATVSAPSSTASTDAPPVTRDHAQLLTNAVPLAEDACTTVTADSSVADMSVAASLPADSNGDGMLIGAGEKLTHTAAAAEGLTSTSSIAASTGNEHRQTAGDASASQPPLRSSISIGGNTAGSHAPLNANNSGGQKAAGPATASEEELRSSIAGEIPQALSLSNADEQSGRSITSEAAGSDKPRRSFRLSRTGSAGGVSVSSHAQPERSVSPQLLAAWGASLSGDQTSVKHGQTSIDTVGERPSCLTGATPLSAPAGEGQSLLGASPSASSVKSIDSMGTSLHQLGERAATPVGASLSQLGKAGGGGVIRHSVILTGLDPLDQWLYSHPSVLASLDYDKVKADLQVCRLSLQCYKFVGVPVATELLAYAFTIKLRQKALAALMHVHRLVSASTRPGSHAAAHIMYLSLLSKMRKRLNSCCKWRVDAYGAQRVAKPFEKPDITDITELECFNIHLDLMCN